LNGEVARIMQAPDIQKRLAAEGATFSPWTPEQFGAFVKAEQTKWAKVVKEAGIRVD
jgi:tripartite-type tricarboxylate transporter receptor subunit TctC